MFSLQLYNVTYNVQESPPGWRKLKNRVQCPLSAAIISPIKRTIEWTRRFHLTTRAVESAPMCLSAVDGVALSARASIRPGCVMITGRYDVETEPSFNEQLPRI